MKERITFVHSPDDAFDSKQLRVEDGALHVRSLKAAREDQLTFSFSELPQEVFTSFQTTFTANLRKQLWRVLKQCHELHIRWTSTSPYSSIAPFVSRTSPGLHLAFSPHVNRTAYVSAFPRAMLKDQALTVCSDLLCPLLHKVFGEQLKCASPEVWPVCLVKAPYNCILIHLGNLYWFTSSV